LENLSRGAVGTVFSTTRELERDLPDESEARRLLKELRERVTV